MGMGLCLFRFRLTCSEAWRRHTRRDKFGWKISYRPTVRRQRTGRDRTPIMLIPYQKVYRWIGLFYGVSSVPRHRLIIMPP